jgi:hypothetical protein
LIAAAAVVPSALTACGDSDDTGGSVESRRWSVDGLSFDNPHGYKKLDGDTVADAASGNSDVEDVADDMGIPADAMVDMIGQFDLYLVGASSAPGFADNVTVVEQPGKVPTKKELEAQFEAVGAVLLGYAHVDTDLGEVVAATYSLNAGKVHIEGETIVADLDGPVLVTVTSSERATTDKVAKGILDTLDED